MMVSRNEVVLQPVGQSSCPRCASLDEKASRASLAHALGAMFACAAPGAGRCLTAHEVEVEGLVGSCEHAW